MRTNRIIALMGAAAMLASFTGFAGAQPPAHPTIPSTQRHPMFGGMAGRMGARPGVGSIVGNKNTKVYHLAGDKGNMPAEKNRVYFRTEREAMAAGYRIAGAKRLPTHRPTGKMMHPMTGGKMMHPMTGGHMSSPLPK